MINEYLRNTSSRSNTMTSLREQSVSLNKIVMAASELAKLENKDEIILEDAWYAHDSTVILSKLSGR